MSGRVAERRRSSRVRGLRAGSPHHGGLSAVYRRFLPTEFPKLLGKSSVADIRLGDSTERDMSILFADIRDFTSLSESLTPRETFLFINGYLKEMEPALLGARGVIDKYMGDAIMAIFPTGADDALRGAVGMLQRLRRFNAGPRRTGGGPVRVGIGLNAGPTRVGAVGGPHRIQTTVISDAVNLASRLQTLTKTWGLQLLISEQAFYSLKDPSVHDIRFVDRVRVRGKERPQSIYEVFDADPPALRRAKRRTRPIFEEALACYHFRDIRCAARLLRRCLARCPQDTVARLYLERCRRYQRTGVHEGTGETLLSIEWTPGCRIGHKAIDRQHRGLFSKVNRFVAAMRRAKTGAEARELCAFLRRYVKEHFETEERVMREAGYPLRATHQQQHERFTRDFETLDRELRERLPERRVFLLFRIQLLVVDWIVHHTMKVDRHFGRYLAGRARLRRRKGGQR